MANLEELRPLLSEVHDLQVQADGYAVWLVWPGTLNAVVPQILEEYGGFKAAENADQGLWFFFSIDAVLAAARLGVWSRFNPLALELRIFPAKLEKSKDGQVNLLFDEDIWSSRQESPTGFRISVHHAMRGATETQAGVKLPPLSEDGVAQEAWPQMDIDPRLAYQSPLSWIGILHPVGSVEDKAFQVGWREFLGQVESLLQKGRFRFSLHGHFLLFQIDTLPQLKFWCAGFLEMLHRLKTDHTELYWPSVMAVVDRSGMSLNEDVPKKTGLDWSHLVPDYPHMSMRNALLLGDTFIAHDVRFARVRHHPDDWVSVSLRGDQEDQAGGSMPQLIPVSVVFGQHPWCFYCGQRSHSSANCPSRSIDTQAKSVWPQVGRLDFNVMREQVAEIDATLSEIDDEEKKLAAVRSLLQDDSSDNVMLKAFYDQVWPVQLRAVPFFWRARSKDLQKAAKNLVPLDKSPLWEVLAAFASIPNDRLDETLKELGIKHSKDFRLHSLRGFWAMERNELEKAGDFWKEAERLSPHPVLQSWHLFLQARAMECDGRYGQAAQLYDQIFRACPQWFDAEYRRVVCMVKGGFTDAALGPLAALIHKSGHFFNRALIDPELDRGSILILGKLKVLWTSMTERAGEEVLNLGRIRDELGTWFLPDNAFAAEAAARIERMLERSTIENYVAYQMLINGRARIERSIQTHLLDEARAYKERFKSNTARLKQIHDESAWFPFPRALAEFNRSYNEGVLSNNWALKANFHAPESFRKAQMLTEQEGERLKKLENRLKFLRIVRDSTLFVLTTAETFLWLEAVGLILIFAVLPLLLFYGEKIGLDMLTASISQDRWPLQKAMLILMTAFAAGVAALRTLLRFETIRDKILAKAKAGTLKPGKRR